IDVKDNNININNPNITMPSSIGNAITGVGVGASIAGGMSAAATVAKSSALPPSMKVAVAFAGGAIAGGLFVATNAINTISQKAINTSDTNNKDVSNNYPTKSVNED